EQRFHGKISDDSLPYEIKIFGGVDRIELRNNTIRIIDYKTGKVESKNLLLNDFTKLTLDTKYEKIIQLLCYILMFESVEEYKNYPIEAGIISFKNMKSGFMPFALDKKQVDNSVNKEILEDFKSSLISLIQEILNPEIPFIEKI
ncbi:MAG TPA: PD-(D/E)XK nuclease family protein, partial [Flavobacterium sp.]|nr:PD-(D/E)XK nuclease family protein [Flavobacterium sp.]